MSWEELARCRDADPELFFDHRATSERKAKSVCRSCPVQRDCLMLAIESHADFGVWGGMNSRERRRLHRQTPSHPQVPSLEPAMAGVP